MPGREDFQYAILRVVPQVERGESLNAGVALHSRRLRFLGVRTEVDGEMARAEPDPEIQDLIRASAGLNLGVDFLPGALPYSPAAPPDADLAAAVVWLDALVENVDRTPRNPNLLRWHGRLWLIDHGAALYLQHAEPHDG